MSKCFDFDECDCDCHRSPAGTVNHCMPCCFPCVKCGKNIRMSVDLEKHMEECDGTMEALEWVPLDIDSLKIKF